MKRNKKSRSGGSLAMRLAGGAIGGALAQVLAGTVMRSLNPTISNVVLVGAGAVLPEIAPMKGINEAGAGLIAVGAAGLAKSFIPGITPSTSGVPFSRFNNAIGNTDVDKFYSNMIRPASDQAIMGKARSPKKKDRAIM